MAGAKGERRQAMQAPPPVLRCALALEEKRSRRAAVGGRGIDLLRLDPGAGPGWLQACDLRRKAWKAMEI